jgi:hypothetical protein
MRGSPIGSFLPAVLSMENALPLPITLTLNTYSHVFPVLQCEAAAAVDAALGRV